jgi:hypothetical protein
VTELSERVVKLTAYYIGPAASRFLERQTASHMNGLKLSDSEKKHLPELAKWVNISAGLLIDKTKAQELANKISAYACQPRSEERKIRDQLISLLHFGQNFDAPSVSALQYLQADPEFEKNFIKVGCSLPA